MPGMRLASLVVRISGIALTYALPVCCRRFSFAFVGWSRGLVRDT